MAAGFGMPEQENHNKRAHCAPAGSQWAFAFSPEGDKTILFCTATVALMPVCIAFIYCWLVAAAIPPSL